MTNIFLLTLFLTPRLVSGMMTRRVPLRLASLPVSCTTVGPLGLVL